MSATLIGSAILGLLLAGYVAQKYGLPPPPPKISGIDLGTTFSSIGVYHAVTGDTEIIPDDTGRRSVPSVVAFLGNGSELIGISAVEQQEHNPTRTIYDAKRFIGRTFDKDSAEFQRDLKRYPFQIELNEQQKAYFVVPLDNGTDRIITPEEVGSIIIAYLRRAAEKSLNTPIDQAVISVPAEFDQIQRNATQDAASLAGLEIRRIISEPTAAALAYGLHKKKGVENVIVVDLGGGTLDVSVLWLQGGMFVTRAMAGNNRLGGQDFNDRVLQHLLKTIKQKHGTVVSDKEDVQQLRLAVEAAKIQLTSFPHSTLDLKLRSVGHFKYHLTRNEFENLNGDLFASVLEPVKAALEDAELSKDDVDEIILVGGSTRIPKVRQVVGTYFGKAPNYGVDPELAVVTGAAVQAGVIGGGWPLQVSAMELPVSLRKRHIYHETTDMDDNEL
uniref:Heat shock 70 kDa protein 13 n=1 Tax=Plectus sambesii TaxID=2011161 RepID=A0A914WZP2_9BILA